MLRKKIKAASQISIEVMNSPCCDEDEKAGSEIILKMKKRMTER